MGIAIAVKPIGAFFKTFHWLNWFYLARVITFIGVYATICTPNEIKGTLPFIQWTVSKNKTSVGVWLIIKGFHQARIRRILTLITWSDCSDAAKKQPSFLQTVSARTVVTLLKLIAGFDRFASPLFTSSHVFLNFTNTVTTNCNQYEFLSEDVPSQGTVRVSIRSEPKNCPVLFVCCGGFNNLFAGALNEVSKRGFPRKMSSKSHKTFVPTKYFQWHDQRRTFEFNSAQPIGLCWKILWNFLKSDH